MAIILIACFSGLVGRLFYLHVLDHSRLSRIVENNRQNVQVLHARRGNIIDVKGNILATTHQVYEIGVDPKIVDTEKDGNKLLYLADLLNVDVALIQEKCATKTFSYTGPDGVELRDVRWKKIVDSADELTYRKVKELKIKGIYGNLKYAREYPSGGLAAHVLGFINKEGTSVMGVERYMDFYMNGQDGWRESERDGRKRELAQFRSREVQPTHGLNVELSIDQMVQHIIEAQIREIVKKYTPVSATIIVSEPATGDILGLANYPSYDPNLFWKSPVSNHRNRAITDVIEPGSTFKIVTAAAALNEDLVRPRDIVDCGVKSIFYNGRNVPLPGDHHEYGKLSVRDVVIKSSNRGAVTLGMLLGNNRMYNYASAFGFGEKSGYDQPGESIGRLLPVSRWDWMTIRSLPMGHSLNATPMQIHYSVSAIANNGVLVEPRLIRRIFDNRGETVVSFNTTAKRRVISSRTAKVVSNILAGVVAKGGTATRANLEGFEVAGKTGTTQKIIDGKYSSKHHVASFVGFFPASDPRLVISVIVDEPLMSRPGYGGVVSAPVFHNIAEQLVRYLGIQPVKGSKNTLALKGDNFDWLR